MKTYRFRDLDTGNMYSIMASNDDVAIQRFYKTVGRKARFKLKDIIE